MQLELDFPFKVDNSSAMANQSPPGPSTSTRFSSATSACEPFTPASRLSTPSEFSLHFDGIYTPFGSVRPLETSPPSDHISKYIFGGSIKTRPQQLFFDEASTTIQKIDGIATPTYGHPLKMNMASKHSIVSLTPSSMTIRPTLLLMTCTNGLSGFDVADSTSQCFSESPNSFFTQKDLGYFELERSDMDRYSQSPLEIHHFHGPPSPARPRADCKMAHGIQRKTTKLQGAQIRSLRKGSSSEPKRAAVDIACRAMCKCDYPGCYKAFRRNEHLKRHKQTFHGEGPNQFSCEFCGKDQFNRQDNLNTHRKLHARRKNRNRGVKFIAAAVPIIWQEERHRKRRVPPELNDSSVTTY